MLLQLDSPDSPESVAREMAEKIINLVSRQFLKITLSAGIGSCCTQLADFRYSYKSAQKAIEIGKTLKKEGEVISLEQLGVHALLFGSMDPEDLYDFAARQIGVLLKYDETNQAELIPTLHEFLNHHCNVERTAKSMNISLSGLKYRLQRIEEIIGQNPKDPQISFNLQLALSILQVAGKDILRSLLKSH
jgi:DNA-binding PucR family transcriptional regulator